MRVRPMSSPRANRCWGAIGIDATRTQPGSTLTGITPSGHSQHAIRSRAQAPLTIVGARNTTPPTPRGAALHTNTSGGSNGDLKATDSDISCASSEESCTQPIIWSQQGMDLGDVDVQRFARRHLLKPSGTAVAQTVRTADAARDDH